MERPDSKIATERRQLTVMFCDLVGSTHISQQLEPENFHKLINEYQRRSGRIVTQLDGYIAQFLGDGILIYFGYPKAHEDDAQRAVKAAISIKQALSNLKVSDIRLKKALTIRLGIHTGNVVIGKVGGTSRREQLALGDVPNVAALIQKSARPNEILISANTYQLIKGSYITNKLTPNTKKKSSNSIDLYRVIGDKKNLIRFEAHTTDGLTPLVGRRNQLRVLRGTWERVVRRCKGEVCLINGEAGIGKSRLVYEFRQSISNKPHTLLECQCWETAKNSPLSPILNLLERMLEFEDKDSQGIKIEKIKKLLRRHRFNLKQTVPLITHLLSLPLPDGHMLPLLTPEKLKRESMEAFIKLLGKFSENNPLVFVIEDMHWADPSTLELLSILINNYRGSRILSLFTHRPEFKPGWNKITKIELLPLDEEECMVMAEKLVSKRFNDSEIESVVTNKSDGIPLYIEEITKALLEASDVDSIPITLNDYLMARLDNLGKAKEIAQAASIIGREFDRTLLISIPTINRDLIDSHLDTLSKNEIIYSSNKGRYIFKHTLIQNAAYESLPKSKRREYHKEIAVILERINRTVDEEHPDLLAYHFEKAGDVVKAIQYLAKAGAVALKISALEEAVNHLIKGLNLLKSQKDTKERDLLEINLLKHLQPAFFASQIMDLDYYFKISERLISLCQKWNLIEDIIIPLQGYIHALHVVDCEKMYRYTKILNKYAKRLNNIEAEISSLTVSGSALGYAGKYHEATNFFDRAVKLYDQNNSTHDGFLLNDKVQALGQSSYLDWQLGYADISIEKARSGLQLARRSNNQSELPFMLIMATLNYIDRNHFMLANETSKEGLEVSEKRGFSLYNYYYQVTHIYTALALRETNEKDYKLIETIYRNAFTGLNINPIIVQYLAGCFIKLSNYKLAIEVVGKSIDLSRRRKQGLANPQFYRLMGDCLLLISERNEKKAEECYLMAIEVSKKQKTKFLELKAAICYGKLLISQGREAEAKNILGRIVKWFIGRNKAEIHELSEAKEMLDGLN